MTYPSSSDFPTDNTADTAATIVKLDQLVRDGFLTDPQAAVVLDNIGIYIDTIAETYALTSAVYTGTAGSTDRKYALVPVYPLPATSLGQNLIGLPNPPPQGWPSSDVVSNATAATGLRQARYGKLGTQADVPSTQATLDADDYVTLVLPAASGHFPTVKFDVLVEDASSGVWNAIALAAAPGSTVTDNGLTRVPYSITPNTSPRYQHAEQGVDTSGETAVILYGSNVFVEGGVV